MCRIFPLRLTRTTCTRTCFHRYDPPNNVQFFVCTSSLDAIWYCGYARCPRMIRNLNETEACCDTCLATIYKIWWFQLNQLGTFRVDHLSIANPHIRYKHFLSAYSMVPTLGQGYTIVVEPTTHSSGDFWWLLLPLHDHAVRCRDSRCLCGRGVWVSVGWCEQYFSSATSLFRKTHVGKFEANAAVSTWQEWNWRLCM